jgi:hypothetical protein
MGWIWVPTAKHVVRELAELVGEKQASIEYINMMQDRVRELIGKVSEFDREYFSGDEDVCLGYLIILKPYNIFVKAIVIYGENEPKIAVVDIEEWLRDKDDP